MTPSPDWNLLGRYLAGETTPDESRAVRAWLDEHPQEADAITRVDAAARAVFEAEELDVEAALHLVKTNDVSSPASRRGRPSGRLAGVLAAAGVLFFATLMWRGSDGAGGAGGRLYETKASITDTIVLEDGTRIVLAPESRLHVEGRDIELSGAAFLDIAGAALGPYAVRASGAVIRDVGTAFSVRAYRDEPLTIVVSQGSVEVALAATRLLLDSGTVGHVDAAGQLVRRTEPASEDDLAWTRGRLIFRDAPLQQVAADLRRWFGVELRVTDTILRDRHFTGSFTTESSERVLQVLSLALGAHVERRGDTAILSEARQE